MWIRDKVTCDPPFEITAGLVRPYRVTANDLAIGALRIQARTAVSDSLGMLADVTCQQAGASEFIRIAVLFGFLAGP